MKCTDISCKSIEHRHQIDSLFSQICNTLQFSSLDFIPSSKSSDSAGYIVHACFNEHEIAEMWRDHYKLILNSVKNNSKQQYVTDKINLIKGQSILFSLMTLMTLLIL